MSDLTDTLARNLGELSIIAIENRKRAEAAEAKLKALQEAVESHLSKAWGYEKTFTPLRDALAQSKE